MKYLAILILTFLSINSNAQTQPSFIVHEWGTFTTHFSGNGIPYTDLYKTANEPVPPFVHNFIFTGSQTHLVYNSKAGLYDRITSTPILLDVTTKMETPVLYFYSSEAIQDLFVNVKFPQGSISEFYPLPFNAEDTNTLFSKTLIDKYGRTSLSFKNYNGFATWKINVLSPTAIAKPTEPDNSVPKVWLAPRQTKSNMIEAYGEYEKYIFYRGLGGFKNPITLRYTKSGKILLENKATDNIPYFIIYEMTPDGKRYIWAERGIEKGKTMAFVKGKIEISDVRWEHFYREHFVESLVHAGLYRDEAEAMLNTWNESYFGKPGIKVFWIVPRSFTDTTLPISFSTNPSHIERVMVGRAEIDAFNPKDTSYIPDPIISSEDDKVIYSIWPNPTSDELYIRSNKLIPEEINYEIIDYTGTVVGGGRITIEVGIDNQLLIGKLKKGVYCLNLKGKSPSHLNLVVN